jgi:hypothetical protein
MTEAEDIPEVVLGDDEAELREVLRAAQTAMVRHPVAAQALFSALVAEGRRFGETPEGAAWRARLEGSTLIRRGRVVWEVGTLNVLEEHSDAPMPTKILDALAKAAAVRELEPMLARLFGLDAAP